MDKYITIKLKNLSQSRVKENSFFFFFFFFFVMFENFLERSRDLSIVIEILLDRNRDAS